MGHQRKPDRHDRGDDQQFYRAENGARLSSAALYITERIKTNVVIGHGDDGGNPDGGGYAGPGGAV